MRTKFSALLVSLVALGNALTAQTNPAITSWLQNTTVMGRHYVANNSTPIQDAVLANCQTVQYSTNWVYVSTHGIPTYVTGPFQDGNPSLASDQNAIFKFPLNPTQNTGVATATTGGNIGVFINGVALFDYRDGVSWNNNTQAEGGGPIQGPPGQGIWNRDAIVAERAGFDCAKGHPAMGNYHHHQNPSAFDLDINVISTVCSLYDADGLYVINPNEHSPLIGFAYDGFPIYGAYGYANTDGTGGITRMKSSYQLRDITTRTTYADGTDVTDGPAVSTTYPLGHYREDYEFVAHTEQDFLDAHNGRFCVTPEYPNGIYAYFCTVDANHNSAYPYAVGPTFYGNKVAAKVTTVSEATTTYTANGISEMALDEMPIKVFPNPANDIIVVQVGSLVTENIKVTIHDMTGRLISTSNINAGATLTYLDTRTLYAGQYVVTMTSGTKSHSEKVVISH
jgi:YHYH protein/Secretion system C-terminal sorting domain